MTDPGRWECEVEYVKILTVSVAAYQVEEYLEQTLTSLLLPDVTEEIEVLVVDDGSTDRTAEIAGKYQQMYPDTVRLIRQENGGHGAAVERGIQEAAGIYFKTIDGDDWVEESAFRSLVQYLRSDDRIDAVCSAYDWVDHRTGKPLKRIANTFAGLEYGRIYPFTEVSDQIYINMHAMTYRTQLIQKYMPSIDHHCFYVDAEYVLLPVPYIQSVAFLEESVYQYRLGLDGQSMNLRNMQKNCGDHETVLERILEAYKMQRELTASIWKRGSRDETDRQAAICRYLAKGAARLVSSQIKIYLSFPASSKAKAKIRLLERRIRKEYPEVWEANENRAVDVLRRSNYKLYLPASWMVRRKLTS